MTNPGSPVLSPAVAQGIVVAATPSPGKFTGPSQQLLGMDVITASDSATHSAKVQAALKAIGWKINRSDVNSAPTAKVSESTDSVIDNAKR